MNIHGVGYFGEHPAVRIAFGFLKTIDHVLNVTYDQYFSRFAALASFDLNVIIAFVVFKIAGS